MMNPNQELARYEAESGNEIVLTADVVRNYISTDPGVTDKEVMLFAALCKAHSLDPFIKEVHLIKYGNSPATIVTGKEVFTKRAYRHPRFRGMEAGVTILTVRPDGSTSLHRRKGSMAITALGETIVGGWAKVYVHGYEHPIFEEVSFEEYAARRKDGSLNGQWSRMPGTMIRKVALVHALREAFPEEFQGLYDSVEMGMDDPQEPVVETAGYDDYETEEI